MYAQRLGETERALLEMSVERTTQDEEVQHYDAHTNLERARGLRVEVDAMAAVLGSETKRADAAMGALNELHVRMAREAAERAVEERNAGKLKRTLRSRLACTLECVYSEALRHRAWRRWTLFSQGGHGDARH
eukprot:Hpha_TRINITY_DN16524_c2_g4::TRINITY_DN16524_c2_g4_i1::g.133770::m.133770